MAVHTQIFSANYNFFKGYFCKKCAEILCLATAEWEGGEGLAVFILDPVLRAPPAHCGGGVNKIRRTCKNCTQIK